MIRDVLLSRSCRWCYDSAFRIHLMLKLMPEAANYFLAVTRPRHDQQQDKSTRHFQELQDAFLQVCKATVTMRASSKMAIKD